MNAKSVLFMLLICALIGENVSATNQLNEGDLAHKLTNSNEPTSYFAENSINDLFNERTTFDRYLLYGMRSLSLIAGYDNDLHRYDSTEDLVRSFVRNLSYTDDIGHMRAHIDPSELDLLKEQSELTLIENELEQSRCEQQLKLVLGETTNLYADFNSYSNSKQLSLIDYLDSFGSPSSQLLEGDFMWLGSYQQCSRSRLAFDAANNDDEIVKKTTFGGRYCIANFRSPSWPIAENEGTSEKSSHLDGRLGSESIKLGICLPESCNSISIHRHGKKIDALVKLTRLNQIPYNGYKLTHLYCLPDDNSPLRQYSLSAQLFILTLSSWLTVVVYFSLKYEYIRMKHSNTNAESQQALQAAEASNCMKIFAFRLSWSKLFQCSDKIERSGLSIKVNNAVETSSATKSCDERESGIETSDSESTSGGSNTGSELMSYSPDELMRLAVKHDEKAQEKEQQILKATNLIEAVKNASHHAKFAQKDHSAFGDIMRTVSKLHPDMAISQRKELSERISTAVVTVNSRTNCSEIPKQAEIDLAVIDGIKVLSMIWLISAHTLLFFIRNISNGRDFWSILKDARFMTIMAGIFPVDTFFTITGVLTAFLKFNKNDGQAMGKAQHWIEALVHRYLRFMPMYLIVFWYTRDISQYIGSGPLWDYATTDTSLRSVCKQESFSVPLLFQANFKPIDQHCVKPAWYLANDFQYLLITPVFVGLIMKSTLLGYSIIGLSIAASLILQFLTVFYSTEMDDFQALINFKPMFGAYVLKNLWRLYVLPYNRIPPYLLGILTGHLMYSLKKCAQTGPNNQNDVKFQSQNSLTSLSTTHHNSTNNILKAPKQQCSIGFIGTLSSYICIKVWLPLMVLISIIYLPLLTKVSTQEGLNAKIGSSSIIALMRLIWSIAIARLIYICSTRSIEDNDISSTGNRRCDSFIIRFLSSHSWKPWSKMGLSALLIQWEVISYLAQTQTNLPNMTITFTAAVILFCVFVTYSLALVTYLAIEYPLSQIERLYVHPMLNKR